MIPAACLCIPPTSSLDQSKCARVKEHRLSENTIGLVCRLPRAQGLTRLIHPLMVCAFGEQGRSTALTLSYSSWRRTKLLADTRSCLVTNCFSRRRCSSAATRAVTSGSTRSNFSFKSSSCCRNSVLLSCRFCLLTGFFFTRLPESSFFMAVPSRGSALDLWSKHKRTDPSRLSTLLSFLRACCFFL